MSPWLHLVDHCEGFFARVPASLYPWLALARGFDLGYMLYAAAHHMLPVLEVALQLLVPDAPALFEDPAARKPQLTPLSAPPTIGSSPYRSTGLAAYWGLPFSRG